MKFDTEYNFNSIPKARYDAERGRSVDKDALHSSLLHLGETERNFRLFLRNQVNATAYGKASGPSAIKINLLGVTLPKPSEHKQNFSKDAKPVNPIRTRKSQPVGSHLGGEFDEISRFRQGSSGLKIEPAKVRFDQPQNGYVTYESVNVNFSKPFESKVSYPCVNEVFALTRNTSGADWATYRESIRQIGLCSNCYLPVKNTGVSVIELTNWLDEYNCGICGNCEVCTERKQMRLQYNRKQKGLKDENGRLARYASLYEFADRKTIYFADIASHFEVFTYRKKLQHRFVGVLNLDGSPNMNVRLARKAIKVELSCNARSGRYDCKHNKCRCTRKVKTYYSEHLVDIKTKQVIEYVPATYRVIDEKCKCI